MIRATFTHKDKYKPGELRIDHTAVSFTGDEEIVDALNALSQTVQYDKSRLCDYEMGFLGEERMNKVAEINGVKTQLAELKRERFLKLKGGVKYARYKELNNTLGCLVEEEQAILGDIEDLEADRFYSGKELTARFNKMLGTLSFVCREATTDTRGVTIEHLETTIPDREVMMGIATANTLLERGIAEKKAAILVKHRGEQALEQDSAMETK